MTVSPLQVVYVLSTYPALSNTFIQREISAIEDASARGALARPIEITRVSVNRPAPHDLATEVHRREQSRTVYLRSVGLWTWLRILVTAVREIRGGLMTVAWITLRTGHWDLRELAWRGFYFAEALEVWWHVRSRSIDHVHAHFGQGTACVAWCAAELLRRDPASPVAPTWSFTIHGWLEFLNEKADAMKEKIEAADLTFCIADHTVSQARRIADPAVWDRIRVVRCGVDLERFAFRPHPPRHDVAVIVTVARLAPEKGHVVLFEALRLLRDRGRRLEVRLAGAGPFRDRLEQLAEELGVADSVTFLGPVSQDEIPDLLADADVFCLPSFSEGLPVSLMEALAIGVPSVATAITGVGELIEDGVTGRLVSAARADALASAIESLLDDTQLRDSVAAAGRSRVEERFDAAKNGRELAALLLTLDRPALKEHR